MLFLGEEGRLAKALLVALVAAVREAIVKRRAKEQRVAQKLRCLFREALKVAPIAASRKVHPQALKAIEARVNQDDDNGREHQHERAARDEVRQPRNDRFAPSAHHDSGEHAEVGDQNVLPEAVADDVKKSIKFTDKERCAKARNQPETARVVGVTTGSDSKGQRAQHEKELLEVFDPVLDGDRVLEAKVVEVIDADAQNGAKQELRESGEEGADV